MLFQKCETLHPAPSWSGYETSAINTHIPRNPRRTLSSLNSMRCGTLWKKNKRWVWKAFCRDTGELIAWQWGDRDKATLKKLLKRLENSQVKRYDTDDWKPYKSLIPAELWVQTKAETHASERNNCQMRHGFRGFKRKSIIVSKGFLERVNATIAVFARFRVNGDVFDILKIGQTKPNIII